MSAKPFRFFNTLSRKVETLAPLDPPKVGLYTCGPTVYQYAHIGNLRTYIFEDLLRRSLAAGGWKVRHVMNITDVGHLTSDADTGEDKMEKSARAMGKTAWELAEFFTQAFFRDHQRLNCLPPDDITKATDFIGRMIELVRRLEDRGFTYRTSDGIYYDTSKFPSYGALAGPQHLEGLKAGARVEQSPEKKNVTDFALWKFSPTDAKRQMEWDSPWGRGFPGWHIECSAMAMDKLGETFDIHCGGVDHIPVHHTNEIAQSEAATGKPFVKVWLHGEFLVLGGKAKMAKSADNFLTLDRLIEEGKNRPGKTPYDPLAYRYLCLTAHYRTQLEFGWEAMDSAQKSLQTLREHYARLAQAASPASGGGAAVERFMDSVADDLNLPKALSVAWEVVREDGGSSAGERLAALDAMDKVLALGLDALVKSDIPEDVKQLADQRERARLAKDFKLADDIRRQLLDKGFMIEDTPKGRRLVRKS